MMAGKFLGLTLIVAAGLLGQSLAPARAADEICTLSYSPQVPDGRTADDNAMRIGREQMQAFVKRADDFLACLERNQAAAKAAYEAIKKPTTEDMAVYAVKKEEYEKRYDAGVDAQHAAANRFNEQLKIFRARTGQTGGKSG
jgi:hypothetical protein